MSKTEPALLAIEGLAKSFGNLTVLRDVNLDVRQGEICFLIGPSGGGKSTLLRCMNFLQRPSRGSISFAGQRLCWMEGNEVKALPEKAIRQARAAMPMVFQNFNVFNHRTAIMNVMEGPVHVLKRPVDEARAEALELLRSVGLADKADSYPAQLSGGQKQRVAIARALAMHPKLILFDEPTSALDPELVADVLATIRALAAADRTLIIVSHEMAFARSLATSVHFIADGRIVESGPPAQIFDDPRTERLRTFMAAVKH